MPTQYVPPFILVRRDGKTWERESLLELRAVCVDLGIHRCHLRMPWWLRDDPVALANFIGLKHSERTPPFIDRFRTFEWIVRDSVGRPVPPEDVWSAGQKPYVSHRDELQRKAAERGLPIPYTGVRRWRYRYRDGFHIALHRHIRGMEVDVRDDPDFDEVPASTLAKWSRWRGGIPPNPWAAEEPMARQPYRNWKLNRRTRWRP